MSPKDKRIMANKHVPQDFMVEILLKLPVKSLMRFKCLSKSYRALITDPSFVSKHFSRTTAAAKSQPNLLVFHYLNKFSATVASDDESRPLIDLDPPIPVPDHEMDNIIPYGPCNGIFLLNVSPSYSPDQMMLWNPATREFKVLPSPHHEDSSFWEFFVHGFGVDPVTNDYKVVSILTVMEFDKHKGDLPSAEVYNLSTNSWRKVDINVPAYSLSYPVFNSFVNGVYHWLTKCHNDVSIICFDMSNDVFWKMEVPPAPSESEVRNTNGQLLDCSVAVLDDSLAYVKEYRLFSPLGTRVEVWVMSEYGEEVTWTKRFNIGPLVDRWKFWGFWKDDEVLVAGPGYKPLASYKLGVQRQVKEFPIHVGPEMFQALRYVESIVSLPDPSSVEEEA